METTTHDNVTPVTLSTTLKDLRVFAGRAEATITALKLGADSFEPKDDLTCQRINTLATLMREIRERIESLT